MSAALGARLTDDNPNITDLSDSNRPTKIGESYSELYDNEWTVALEAIVGRGHSERDAVRMLHDVLVVRKRQMSLII